LQNHLEWFLPTLYPGCRSAELSGVVQPTLHPSCGSTEPSGGVPAYPSPSFTQATGLQNHLEGFQPTLRSAAGPQNHLERFQPTLHPGCRSAEPFEVVPAYPSPRLQVGRTIWSGSSLLFTQAAGLQNYLEGFQPTLQPGCRSAEPSGVVPAYPSPWLQVCRTIWSGSSLPFTQAAGLQNHLEWFQPTLHPGCRSAEPSGVVPASSPSPRISFRSILNTGLSLCPSRLSLKSDCICFFLSIYLSIYLFTYNPPPCSVVRLSDICLFTFANLSVVPVIFSFFRLSFCLMYVGLSVSFFFFYYRRYLFQSITLIRAGRTCVTYEI
jgi:hypothetical protein